MLVPVRLANGEYDIHISGDSFKFLAEEISNSGSKYFIVADKNAYAFHGNRLNEHLPGKAEGVFLVQGESNKTMYTVSEILESMATEGLTRSDALIAFGGGVCGDITGFAASVYMRGISYYQVPTTLLSQVDSSVGGKTGVDLKSGKNLAGSFIQPEGVYIDPAVLETLSNAEISQGKAEMIKAAAIKDSGLFADFENGIEINCSNIKRCIEIKLDFVKGDEFDTGKRMILNFGHTIAHAMEKTIGYGEISHGEAVAVGMAMSVRVSEKAGISEKGSAKRLVNLLKKENLPVECSLKIEELADAMKTDKKMSKGMLNAIFLEKIGKAGIFNMRLDDFLEMVR